MVRKALNIIYSHFYWYLYSLYIKIICRIRCAPLYKYMLDAESKRIMHIREKVVSRRDEYDFIREFVKEDMQFRIDLPAEKKVVVCLMEESAVALKRMDYTKVLLEHSQWKNSYRCVRLMDDFCVNDEDVIVPVGGGKI